MIREPASPFAASRSLDHRDWYLRHGQSKPGEVLQGWIARKEQALAKGRGGLRLTGNTYWLDASSWKDFADYEETVNRIFHQHEIVALCSYCLHRCDSPGILDVVRNHQFAVARRQGQWEVLENPSLKLAKEELRRLNAELERRVVERTAALEAAFQERARSEQEALGAVRVRDESLSMASHELKTPLTSLKLQLELVKTAVANTEGELARKMAAKLQTIERQLLRLNALNVERAVPAQHYGGLGLGLYISRTLAEAMGGTIQVGSQPGQGATFTVWLPNEPALR